MIDRGIKFDDIHSYYDLDLILSSVDIPPAKPKEEYIDIPGSDEPVDLTEAHGEVNFKTRDCKFTFTMNPANDLSDYAFEVKKTEVSNALNGKKCKIILDKDDLYFYEGRCTVDEYLSNKRIRQIVVTAKVKPYKFKVKETEVSATLSTTAKTLTLTNGRKTVVPSITCTNANTTVVFEGNSFTFNAGTHKNLNIRLKHGNNTIQVKGSGTVTFKYREGDL